MDDPTKRGQSRSGFRLAASSLELLRGKAREFGTQQNLADALGMPKPTLQKILAGDAEPSFSRVAAMAKLFGLSLDTIAHPEGDTKVAFSDDRSTLERAFGHITAAQEASQGLIRLTERDREVDAAIGRAKAMLGQLLAEEVAAAQLRAELLAEVARLEANAGHIMPIQTPITWLGTPWTRWKAATCDLVNWAAARIMRALYIAPFRLCRLSVHRDATQNGTRPIRQGTCCPTCGVLA